MTTTKMDPNVKEQWLLALRSGDYRQVQGALADRVVLADGEEAFGNCCLGVLCEIAVKNNVIPPRELNIDPKWGDEEWLYAGSRATLPPEVTQWAGLDNPDPRVSHRTVGTLRRLADLNDIDDLSFAEIADLIEEHL